MDTAETAANLAALVMSSSNLNELRDRLNDFDNFVGEIADDDIRSISRSLVDTSSLPVFAEADIVENDGWGSAYSWDEVRALTVGPDKCWYTYPRG